MALKKGIFLIPSSGVVTNVLWVSRQEGELGSTKDLLTWLVEKDPVL